MAGLSLRVAKFKDAGRRLSTAAKSLSKSRETPARTQLAKRIEAIEARLETRSS